MREHILPSDYSSNSEAWRKYEDPNWEPEGLPPGAYSAEDADELVKRLNEQRAAPERSGALNDNDLSDTDREEVASCASSAENTLRLAAEFEEDPELVAYFNHSSDSPSVDEDKQEARPEARDDPREEA